VNRHDDAVRRAATALSGLLFLLGASAIPAAGAGAATPSVRTALGGPGSLHAPSGIALDSFGDLFIADTDHCRVTLVPSRSGSLYGMQVHAHRAYTLAGGACGAKGGIGFPTGVAVDRQGVVYIATGTGQRVLVVDPGGTHGPRSPTAVAGTGVGGYNGDGQPATGSMLDEPTGVAVDAAGDLFIADTGNCRLRMMPVATSTHFGQAMVAGHLYTVAGTGVCGSSGRGGSADVAQLDSPVAVTVDAGGDLFVADRGDDEVLELPVSGGMHYGTSIGAGDLGVVVGTGGNGPYLVDGLPATSEAAELNDPEGVAVNATGTLFVADGSMHCIRAVPASSASVFGRSMSGGSLYTLAGALTIGNDTGAGNGTRWILTHMGMPTGLALSDEGDLYFSDQGLNQIREIR
jgi:sugar lactone lactonase YvrE